MTPLNWYIFGEISACVFACALMFFNWGWEFHLRMDKSGTFFWHFLTLATGIALGTAIYNAIMIWRLII